MKFIELIAAQRKGRFITDAEEKLRSVVKTCMDTGKSGVMTIKLKIQPTGEETLVVEDDLDIKPPKPQTMGSTYYPDEQGELFKDDPKQGEFEVVSKVADAQ